jgi:hypothetical protein
MIPLDYHRYARVIAHEGIAAGEAAARGRLDMLAGEHEHRAGGRRPLCASLLAALLGSRDPITDQPR